MNRISMQIASASTALVVLSGLGAITAASPALASAREQATSQRVHDASSKAPTVSTNQSTAATASTRAHHIHHPLRVPAASRIAIGGCLYNRRTHIFLCAIGVHKYYRKVVVHHHWQKKAFWQMRVSTQHGNKHKLWGRTREWTMPSRFHYGKPIHSRNKANLEKRGGGDCPPNLMGVVAACTVPWHWANNAVNKVSEAVIGQIMHPCVSGGLWGFGGVSVANVWTKIFAESSTMTAAEAGSKFTGPFGMAVTTASACTIAVANHGGLPIGKLFSVFH